ncbi:MAG: M15 family metallopeptidase [Succinivibrio sp.]
MIFLRQHFARLLLTLVLSLFVQISVSSAAEYAQGFDILPIDEATFSRIDGKSYKKDCTVPLSDLRLIKIRHVTADGRTLDGELICNRHIADTVMEIFHRLYEAGYPIEKVRLVDEYDADDELSMRDNNSSSFNFRFISHTTKVSKHGLGLAVDINTLYNPYVKVVGGKTIVEPETALEYTDRGRDFLYKIDENDLAYKLFTQYGFEWGGNWKSCKDYQHFELPDDRVNELYPDNR